MQRILSHELPSVTARATPNEFLPSGLKTVDAFFPMARGSTVALVGQRYVPRGSQNSMCTLMLV